MSFRTLGARQCRWWGILAASVFVFTAAAHAAPVARTANLSLVLTIQGLPGISLSVTGATVMVDDSGGLANRGQISLAAQAITLATPISIPVTATTAIAAIKVTPPFSNLAGAFSIGGAASNVPTTELPCPPAGQGIACVGQSGLGGPMGLDGTVKVDIGPLDIPVPLTIAGLGQGGLNVVGGFTFDAAPWTIRTGQAAFIATTTFTKLTPVTVHLMNSSSVPISTYVTATNSFTVTATQMGTTNAPGSRMTLVSPTYVSALGNLLPLFSEFTIEFTDGQGLPSFVNHVVPEPGALMMLGCGGATIALLGRRRRR